MTGSLADRYAPEPDHIRTEHLVVAASPAETLATARTLDFDEVPGPLLRTALWVRRLPGRWSGPRAMPRVLLPEPGIATIDHAESPWVLLGHRPGVEIATGAVGRFWTPVMQWRRVEPEEFLAFHEPGLGKVVMSLSARPYGEQRCLLSHDIRIVLTDLLSRRRCARYWIAAEPVVGALQRATLEAVRTRVSPDSATDVGA